MDVDCIDNDASQHASKEGQTARRAVTSDISVYEMIRSQWGSEKWIKEGWDHITDEERADIQLRLEAVFKDGLPFEVQFDKRIYIYVFSMLAQLEVMAIQIPMKFGPRMTKPHFKEMMRRQLLDEIFHGLVFTKIAHDLSAPFGQPPSYNAKFEAMCNFIRDEPDPQVAIVLMNLIGEGWIEELFIAFERCNVAPEVFRVIIEDESRHISEADLYREMGLPEKAVLEQKLHRLERFLLTHVLFEYKYILSTSLMIEREGAKGLLDAITSKHAAQIKKINISSCKEWKDFVHTTTNFWDTFYANMKRREPVEMTPTRLMLFSEWEAPRSPSAAVEWSVDVTPLDIFNDKKMKENISILTLQALSQCLENHPVLKRFFARDEVYESTDSLTGLVVNLPDCGDHLGILTLKNCHQLSIKELSKRIDNDIKIMSFCFKEMQKLKVENPHFQDKVDYFFREKHDLLHRPPEMPNPTVILSNIGSYGYEHVNAPLRPSEAIRFTMAKLLKKQVWDEKTNQFVIKDFLPMSITFDHRLVDGNIPVPYYFQEAFDDCFARRFEASSKQERKNAPYVDYKHFLKLAKKFKAQNLEIYFRVLSINAFQYFNFAHIDERIMSY